jgi:hypothetical protein
MQKPRIKYYLLFLLGLSFIACSGQAPPDDHESAIVKLVTAFKEKDKSTLREFIPEENGVILLFRHGIFDQYRKSSKLSFDSPFPDYFPVYDFSKDIKIAFEPLPTYDCDALEWSKIGMFCDTTQTSHLLSKTAKNLNTYMDANIPEKEIESFENLEKNSHRIVLCDSDENEFIFYLTHMDKGWYLTIIDRVTADCST